MCHTHDSRPPAAPNPGEIAEQGPIELVSADGTRVRAYRARPAAPNGRSVVILPDVRGLHPFYEALAGRFAEAGFTAIAIDYFGRHTEVPEDMWARFSFIQHDHVKTDVAAAFAELDGPVYTVGFCAGGTQSWRQAAAGHPGHAGAIGFYGMPQLVEDVLDDMEVPMLLLIAGNDAATEQAAFTAFAERLAVAGKPYEMKVYEGAPHSFFDVAHEQWREACDDAWERVLRFTGAM
ncbi:dienelactone hydrolase family protein [Nonomuraea sediminis]|uniref:dienelactone hydrolase family protein n=1 Tax=Nonomuraea sediminis TaxID=2835864 RepID=UPI001BDBF754|nr:dienelactone hydrolase family protein [Nonomuraea sediminis]